MLSLDGNMIRNIQGLEHCDALEELNLRHNDISGDGGDGGDRGDVGSSALRVLHVIQLNTCTEVKCF